MSIKRRVLSLAALVVLTIALAACGATLSGTPSGTFTIDGDTLVMQKDATFCLNKDAVIQAPTGPITITAGSQISATQAITVDMKNQTATGTFNVSPCPSLTAPAVPTATVSITATRTISPTTTVPVTPTLSAKTTPVPTAVPTMTPKPVKCSTDSLPENPEDNVKVELKDGVFVIEEYDNGLNPRLHKFNVYDVSKQGNLTVWASPMSGMRAWRSNSTDCAFAEAVRAAQGYKKDHSTHKVIGPDGVEIK